MISFDRLRVRYFLHCLFHRNGYEHREFLRKHNAFHGAGKNFFFQPYNLPANARYIRFGNNVVVASNVSFICHDVIHKRYRCICRRKKKGSLYV
jgi:acetyltransferase-like isoleucine patch superfamily enzyme